MSASCRVWAKREHQLTVHLVRLQSRHQVLVHLNKRRLGLLVLIQDQLGGDGAELIVYNNYLQTSAVRETTSGQQRVLCVIYQRGCVHSEIQRSF